MELEQKIALVAQAETAHRIDREAQASQTLARSGVATQSKTGLAVRTHLRASCSWNDGCSCGDSIFRTPLCWFTGRG